MNRSRITGIEESKRNLAALINDVNSRKVVRAMQSALLVGAAQASLFTPIDTATLLNSQFREIMINGSRLTGRVGYSANYAAYVHDPSNPQKFRRATARKEFLRRGFDDSRDEIDMVVKRELSL
ncbi:MAG: hypothetical protein [Bacteriophage sp.]|nr:MAG: hypothetical protein [Bacteriophage sp.]